MIATPGSVENTDKTGTSTPESGFSFTSHGLSALKSSEQPGSSSLSQTVYPGNDDDDASDVSMSPETDDSDNESESGSQDVVISNTGMGSLVPGQKRKMSSGQGTISEGLAWSVGRGENHKRIKLDLSEDAALATYRNEAGHLKHDRSLLPTEIWHQIFSFAVPRALGCSLQVNKVFRAYLDPSSSASPTNLPSLSMSVAQTRTLEAIWQASRRLYYPGMPAPLKGLTELEMWRLACTSTCQFCNRKNQPSSSISIDQWHSGPGEKGVSTIWPFAVRACGPCLQQNSLKVSDFSFEGT
jgi:hypothetical protein